jgi:AcrR family transcriptional regulator
LTTCCRTSSRNETDCIILGLMISRQEAEPTAVQRRTRRAIVDAAAQMLAEGVLPTVGAAAERAEVSRATAYRYFPTQQALVVEAELQTAVTHPDASSTAAIADPANRLAALVRTVNDWAYDHEAHLRLLLRMSLERDDAGQPSFRRPAKRLELLDEWLTSVQDQLDQETSSRLRNALALLFGIDPVVTFTDVCRVSRGEAQEALTWAAATMVRAALSDRA